MFGIIALALIFFSDLTFVMFFQVTINMAQLIALSGLHPADGQCLRVNEKKELEKEMEMKNWELEG